MDLDSDLFSDESGPVINHARGRFQPKAKPRPKKEITVPVDVTDNHNILSDPVGFSLPTSEVVGTIEQLTENEESEYALNCNIAVSDGFGDSHTSFPKEVGLNADLFSGLECLSDIPSQPTNGSEGPAIIDSDCKDGGENVADLHAAFTVCDGAQAQTCPDLFMTQYPVSCRESTVSNNAGGILVDDGRLETEVQGEMAFCNLNCGDFISEEAVASGSFAGKYKPKPKAQNENEKYSASVPNLDTIESVMHLPNAQFVCMSEGSIPVFPPDDVFNYSSIDLGDIGPSDPTTSEFPMNEELTNLEETHAVAAASGDVHQEDVPAMNENLSAMDRKRKASTVSNLSQRSNESSLPGEEIEGGKSSRQQRNNVPELVDECDDEAHENGSFTAEHPSGTADEDEGDVDGLRVQNTSRNQKAPRKSRKPVTLNEKPVRKHKKANEASDKLNNDTPKKFSHSTRRKRRTVSRELLETPEDEIDPQKVPMKDLILLAEYKERLESKEAKTSRTPLTNQSAGSSFCEEDCCNGEEAFASEQGNGSIGDQSTHRVQSNFHYFNYQSFMKKTPTVRWSKQETELFYEAIRQFGTDLSMIQQLFPGRTRQQVKLKYKKEERTHPLRLTEALTNRAKDHSHFEKVIEQLQQVAAQAARHTNGDDSVDLTGEDMEELIREHNDEVGKAEQGPDGEADVGEVQSPLKADESDEDDDIWSSYKSEF